MSLKSVLRAVQGLPSQGKMFKPWEMGRQFRIMAPPADGGTYRGGREGRRWRRSHKMRGKGGTCTHCGLTSEQINNHRWA